MRILFFGGLSNPNRAQFRADYVRQNLTAVRAISTVFFLLAALFKISPFILNLRSSQLKNLEGYNITTTIHLVITPLFVMVSALLRRNFKTSPAYLLWAQFATILFATYLISAGMMASFLSMHNPKNTVTLYMITLVVTAIFYAFEYYEALLVAIITTVVFSVLLPHFVIDQRQLLLNQFVSVILVVVFYSISRYVFSYKANHFIQLKTINEKNGQIELANQLKDEILGIVAHDLRNPLAAIETVAMLMQLDENLDDDNIDNIIMIRASCEKAKLIINDLIEVARNDIEEAFELDTVDLNEFLSEIVKEWWVNKKGAVKLVYYGTQQPVLALINREKMHRVMDNLISNAIKFSRAEDDNVEITLRQTSKGSFIDVKDFGVGIPANLLPNIFDRFSKASRKGLQGEESIGLGLSIVKQIILKHGGDINVESTEKQGSTFTISLNQSKAS